MAAEESKWYAFISNCRDEHIKTFESIYLLKSTSNCQFIELKTHLLYLNVEEKITAVVYNKIEQICSIKNPFLLTREITTQLRSPRFVIFYMRARLNQINQNTDGTGLQLTFFGS